MNTREQLAAVLIKRADVWGTADTIADFVPFVGGVKDMGKGVYDMSQGNYGKGLGNLAWGAGSTALDFAFGSGSLLRGGAKFGLKGLGKLTAMNAGLNLGGRMLGLGGESPAPAGQTAVSGQAPAPDPMRQLMTGIGNGTLGQQVGTWANPAQGVA
jgi:hypothetical protein